MIKTLRSGGDQPLRFRCYPTGEFSATRVREIRGLVTDLPDETYEESTRFTDRSYAKKQVSDELRADIVRSTLGSSNVLNSHKTRKARGRRGMTRYNKRLIVNSCLLLERKYGLKHLSFVTLTLPPQCESADSDLYSESKRQMLQWLQRRLSASLLPSQVIGCTELQGARFSNKGAFALHEHWVFVGRQPHSSWGITPKELQSAWLRILSNVYQVGIPESQSKAACRMESLRKSAGAYIGKYLGKSEAVTEQAIEAGLEHCLPASWVTRSHSMLKMFKASIVQFNIETSLSISHAIIENPSIFCRWSRHLWLEVESGFNIWLGFVGYLNKDGFKLLKSFNSCPS